MKRDESPTPDLVIERLTRSNLTDVARFFESVDARHFAHASLGAASRFIEQPEDVHVIGRASGRVVAFGMLRGWQTGYEVPSLGIAVGREHEGQGYGRAMMAALEQLARARGARRIRLRVHPENERAKRLYERCGYKAEGTERGETVMVLNLGDEPNAGTNHPNRPASD